MCQAIDLFAADPATRVIGIVSKPPADAVAHQVLQHAARAGKPCVVLFLGADPAARSWPPQLTPVTTLHDAAAAAVALVQGRPVEPGVPDEADRRLAQGEARHLAASQRFVRGLYSGGTFCIEAQLLWSALGLRVHSNVAIDAVASVAAVASHSAIDFGSDEYTIGRPHPMIDVSTRIERLGSEARDPAVAAIVLDIVLGYGSHPDPAGALAPAIAQARAAAAQQGRHLSVIAFVCGTEDDPQPLPAQQSTLREAGALVAADSTAAARLAGAIALEATRAPGATHEFVHAAP